MTTKIVSFLNAALVSVLMLGGHSASAQPDILVLGDSQISFGAGKEYVRFFAELPNRCEMTQKRTKLLEKLGTRQTAAIGVRSTSLQSWTSTSGPTRGAICDVDKKYGVNAGAYGIDGNPDRVFIQIGKGKSYQFCKPKQTAFESMFADGYYDPDLLILTFLGNSADRWANSPDAAEEDVRRTLAQVPEDTACIYISSAPVYLKKTNDKRMKAQTAIARAFDRADAQCIAVEGFNAKTRAAIEGNPKFFRRNDAGRVKDPHHPSNAAIRQFLKINTTEFCDAIFSALE